MSIMLYVDISCAFGQALKQLLLLCEEELAWLDIMSLSV